MALYPQEPVCWYKIRDFPAPVFKITRKEIFQKIIHNYPVNYKTP